MQERPRVAAIGKCRPGVNASSSFAKISGTGTVLYSKHVTGVSYSGGLTKTYTITFDQDSAR